MLCIYCSNFRLDYLQSAQCSLLINITSSRTNRVLTVLLTPICEVECIMLHIYFTRYTTACANVPLPCVHYGLYWTKWVFIIIFINNLYLTRIISNRWTKKLIILHNAHWEFTRVAIMIHNKLQLTVFSSALSSVIDNFTSWDHAWHVGHWPDSQQTQINSSDCDTIVFCGCPEEINFASDEWTTSQKVLLDRGITEITCYIKHLHVT